MKKILLLLFTCLPGCIYAQADHFSDTTSRWYITSRYPYGQPQQPGFIATRTDIYFYSGDSIIAGDTWLKLYTSGREDMSAPVFKGYIRSVAPYVLFRSTAGNTDTIYNFSLQAGDSVQYNFGLFSAWVKVQHSDSIQISGNWHKRIRFEEPEGPNFFTRLEEEWIEGIGSVHGPLFALKPRLFSTEVEDTEDLICTYYPTFFPYLHRDMGYNTCFTQYYYSLDQQAEQPVLHIYPNPVRDVLYGNMGVPAEVYVYDQQGRIVYRIPEQGATFMLQLGSLAPGMYYIGVRSGGAVLHKPFIKQ